MKVVLQRVSQASVSVAGREISKIGQGLLLLLGVEDRDTEKDIEYLAKKVVSMRIFADEEGVMNKSLIDVSGEVLLVSQFTLMARTKKGNRPSYVDASRGEVAEPMYQAFGKRLQELLGRSVSYGLFGADMQVALINDGPVTILMDSHNP